MQLIITAICLNSELSTDHGPQYSR